MASSKAPQVTIKDNPATNRAIVLKAPSEFAGKEKAKTSEATKVSNAPKNCFVNNFLFGFWDFRGSTRFALICCHIAFPAATTTAQINVVIRFIKTSYHMFSLQPLLIIFYITRGGKARKCPAKSEQKGDTTVPKKETNWDKVPVIFDIAYAATLLGISLDTMHKLCQKGKFPAFKVGKLWRVNKDDLMTYIDQRKVS